MARTFSHIVFFLLIMLVHPVQAANDSVNRFRTETLYQLAQSLRISPDSVPEGFSCKTIDGNCISLIKEDQMITHIGYHLFSEESHSASHSDVLSFIERIILQLMYPGFKTKEWLLRDYKMKFEKGGISDVKRIHCDDEFSLSIQGGKNAVAIWSRNGKSFLEFSFPMEYGLLSSEDKVEAEANFSNDVLKSVIQEEKVHPQTVKMLKKSIQNDFFTKKGNYYIDKRINSDTYYKLVDGTPSLLLDVTYPAESSANMMLDMSTGGDYRLNFKQILYGYKHKQFQTSLRQWLSFCQIQGCKLYFGIEKILSTGVRASVIAVNELAGYNHVMFVKIPFRVIDDKKGEIEAQIHTYVPMHNVTDLFGSYKKTKKKGSKIFE